MIMEGSDDRNAEGGPNITRRGVLAASRLAGVASAVSARATEPAPAKPATSGGTFLLTNILLETGYEWDGDEVARTTTQKAAVLVKDGTIAEILASAATVPDGVAVVDGEGMLPPSFRDIHIHLDKTFYGGPWVAPRRIKNSVAGQIQRELTLLPTLEERTVALTTLLQRNGATFVRGQCNVDPVIGTKHVEMVKHALDQHADTLGYEIVAFAQHGFLSANLVPTMQASVARDQWPDAPRRRRGADLAQARRRGRHGARAGELLGRGRYPPPVACGGLSCRQSRGRGIARAPLDRAREERGRAGWIGSDSGARGRRTNRFRQSANLACKGR